MGLPTKMLLYILVYVTVAYSQNFCNVTDIKYGPDGSDELPTCQAGMTNGQCNDCYCRAIVSTDGSSPSVIYVNDECSEKQFKQSAKVTHAFIQKWSTEQINLEQLVLACGFSLHLSFKDKEHSLNVGEYAKQCYDLPATPGSTVSLKTSDKPFNMIYNLRGNFLLKAKDHEYFKNNWKSYYETNCMDHPDLAANLCTEATISLNCDSNVKNLLTHYTKLRKLVAGLRIYPDCEMSCDDLKKFTEQIHYETPDIHYGNVIDNHPHLTLDCVYNTKHWIQVPNNATTTVKPTTTTPSTTPTTTTTTKRKTTATTTPTTTTTTATTTTKPPTTTVSVAPGTDLENNHEYTCQLSDLKCHEYIAAGQNTLRTPGLATTWYLIEGSVKSFHQLNFHMWPFTTCQTVHICSGSWENINCSPETSLLYDTMQNTLLVNGQTYFYDLPGVVLNPVDSSSGKYYFSYFTSLANSRVLAPQKGTVQLGKNITILTSSPSCNVFVNSEIGPISHVIHTKTCHVIDHEFKSMAGAGRGTKTFNGLILNASMSKAIPMESDLCDNLFDFDVNEGDMLNKVEEDAGQPVFIAYQLSLKNNARCALKIQDGMFKTSFGINIVEPRNCKWIRLCFNDSTNPGVCTQPSRNLDILPLINIYVPTDTDNAQNFGVPIGELKHISFQLFDINPSPAVNNVVMRMNYGNVDSQKKSIIEDMLLDVDFSKPLTMYLGYSAGCSVSVEEHMENLFKNVDVNQCLGISGCTRLQYTS